MAEIFIKSIVITAVLLLFAAPGYALRRLDMLGSGARTTLGNILLFVCQPALIIAAFTVFGDEEYAMLSAIPRATMAINFCITAALSAAALAAVYAVCRLVFLRNKNKSAADVYTYVAVFSNCAFLGVPFVKMFTDGNALAVMYLMVFNLVFALAVWTLGVYLITHDFKTISPKKVLLNPTILSTVPALLMFFVPQLNIFRIDGLGELAMIPSALSTATAPIAMLLIGIALAETPVKSLFAKREIYVAAALRLIVAPLFTFAIAILAYLALGEYIHGQTIDTDYIFLAPTFAMAMSPASVVVAMTELYNGERELAAGAFITSTLFSILTVPLIILATTELWALL